MYNYGRKPQRTKWRRGEVTLPARLQALELEEDRQTLGYSFSPDSRLKRAKLPDCLAVYMQIPPALAHRYLLPGGIAIKMDFLIAPFTRAGDQKIKTMRVEKLMGLGYPAPLDSFKNCPSNVNSSRRWGEGGPLLWTKQCLHIIDY